ncbi:hypothetical protein [Corallococcus macrosporus]|uniref:Lipoprotein n=1 Tax=Corallococcus macrosporus DSM 14697 TaxID=1189310 RepID=A0A250JUE7_9BACT|nr:hypothetical protein [Corallococcus macrosporus]ATB47484.1 hypothetical protein MYMAC_003098 [Corallococcus macrosporus DSM 14697]
MQRLRPFPIPALLTLVAAGLFASCGGPSAEEDARVCANVQCSAGRCVAEAGAPVCRCGAWEQAAGLTCAIVAYQQEDDHGDTRETATALAPSEGFHEGTINPPFRAMPDRDVFAMPTAAGHGYRFVFRPGTLTPVDVRLVESSGAEVRTRPLQSKEGTRLEFISTEEAPRFITVAAPEGTNASGTYSYRLEDLGQDVHGDTLATATPLALTNTPFLLTLEFAEDADVFTFRTEPNQGFQFSCEGTDVSLQLLDGAGVQMDGGLTWDSSRICAGHWSPHASTWFVRASSSHDKAVTTHCQLDDLGRDEHANGVLGATPLTAGVPMAGRHHGPNDVDVFSFVATAGNIYDLRVLPVRNRSIRLTDANGTTLAETQWNRIVHVPVSAGTYYVHLPADETWGSDFELKVDDRGLDDHGATPATATRADVGETVTGLIHDYADLDAISVPLVANMYYRLSSCQRSCTLTTHTSGAPLYRLEVQNGVWYINTPITELVTFIVSSRSIPHDFTFRVDWVGNDDHGDDADHATPQSVPLDTAGVFEENPDVDVLSFALEAGHTYRVESDRAHLRILNPQGAEVALSSEMYSTTRYFTAESSGTYVAELTTPRYAPDRPTVWSFSLREQ